MPTMVSAYHYSLKLFNAASLYMHALLAGVWLGVLKQKDLHQIDAWYYEISSMYCKEKYILSGLFPWEAKVISEYFNGRKKILLLAAGTGREMLALLEQGFDVVAYEANSVLRDKANTILEQKGYAQRVESMKRDIFPPQDTIFDGIIFGWSLYTLIRRRERRIQLLQETKKRLSENAPLLLSFHCNLQFKGHQKVAYYIGRVVAWICRNEPPDLGDILNPEFLHIFDRSQVCDEISGAGLTIVFSDFSGNAHTVAIR